jgi:copper chaperone CopZ
MPRIFALASACLFASLTAVAAAVESPEGPDEAAVATAVKALKVGEGETIVFVTDLHCANCAKKVTSRLFKLKGVMRVRTSVKLDAAVITPQTKKTVDVEAAWAVLQEAGYQPTRMVGPEGVFIAHEEDLTPVKIAEAPTARRN